jgi:5-methyltetrahydrofolate--homocysteine methyltransferase
LNICKGAITKKIIQITSGIINLFFEYALEKERLVVDIREKLKDSILFFDGAMGTMLQERGLKRGEIPETYNIIHPHIVKEIHKKYVEAGADIITTNTFGANELKLKDTPYSVEEIINAAVKNAKEVAENKYVALDMGPIGQMMEPMGTLKFERAYDIFKRQVIAGTKAGCDLILIETISDLYEMKAAILAAKENSKLPIFATMTFEEDGRTFTGTDPVSMVIFLEGIGVDVLGMNCSLGPNESKHIITKILDYSSIPVMIQPNAGLPKIVNDQTLYDVTPHEFGTTIEELGSLGVRVVGGCCGTNDKFIREVVNRLKDKEPVKVKDKEFTAVTSATKNVIIDEVVMIGERINPTGKKKFKEALRDRNIDYILKEAILQKEKGAHILDVNVGLPEIDEIGLLKDVTKEVQSIVDLPLQIDSTDPVAIEAAIRAYNGKAIINSVNGKESVMKDIFPIVKKYGACVVALTLDEDGIPSKAEDRVKIAEKIIQGAKEYGIDKKHILIDCLVLTASAQQEEVLETIRAVKMVKEKFNVKTTLGVSNVSFGLPNRRLLNKTFLSMALASGLDAPIVNPKDEDILETIFAYKVLANEDKESKIYIDNFKDVKNPKGEVKTSHLTLQEIIIKGLKAEAKDKTIGLLKEKAPIQIVNEDLIPALDIVGNRFEEGSVFLPQLIISAETVKRAFEVIKDRIKREEEQISKGKLILATVQGDIHDIGKNIVKVILENYGFEVIDLGKDVDPMEIVQVAKDENIKLIGLSALMTTTVKSMEETIRLLRENEVECEVFVGGAVLNEEYAQMIKADYYAKDAKIAVEIANKVLN